MKDLSEKITISIDLMGGDKSPSSTIEGVKMAIKKYNNVHFKLFGKKDIIVRKYPSFIFDEYDFIDCQSIIEADDKPSIALRNSHKTSMRLAIESVANNEAHASVSAGNTGALMAISKVVLKTLPGISRPAICGFIPSKKKPIVMLDLGANVDCEAKHLLEFAIMGDAFLSALLGKKHGKIALLNIGSEEGKGSKVIKEANDLLINSVFKDRYAGYIEPNNVFNSDIDIVVTDGFNGNIFIKTGEGIGKLMQEALEESFSSSIMANIAYLLVKNALKKSIRLIDPRNHNGAMFVGLNGISVKSHGGTDSFGFAKAIDCAVSLAYSKVNNKIGALISKQTEDKKNSFIK